MSGLRIKTAALWFVALVLLLAVPACATKSALGTMPSGTAVSIAGATSRDFLYVTDREPVAEPNGKLEYSSLRARFMSFGDVTIAENGKGAASVSNIKLIGQFPKSPYPVDVTPSGPRRSPATVALHEAAESLLQAEVTRRVARSKRKEVVIFVHGYNNTFDDAAETTGRICDGLDNDFVCIVLTWPAGGSSGILFGYNVDSESAEFATVDIKKAIRIISQAKGVEHVHLMAHSRGTAVLTSAVQQLGIEAYVSQSSLSGRYKVANIILFAPDIDLDVAATKLFGIASDPDLIYGRAPRAGGTFPQGAIHLTVYSSPNDKALGLSQWLFGSALRLGQLDVGRAADAGNENVALWQKAKIGSLVDFIQYKGGPGFIGHDYFLSDPKVSKDFALLVSGGVKAGDPRRPLVEIARPFWRIEDSKPPPQLAAN